jgi:hypothetical protein
MAGVFGFFRPLPAQQPAETAEGIAAAYPGDRGIRADPRVVFSEDFEQPDLEAIGKRWEMVRNVDVMSLSKDVPQGSSGVQSLLMS